MNVTNIHGGKQAGVIDERLVLPRTQATEVMPRGRRVSCFDVSLMRDNTIHKRELQSFSVHFSVATSKWIATLPRPDRSGEDKRGCVSFPFPTERDARKFGKAYAPPKMVTNKANCMLCSVSFDAKCRPHNCRNCGALTCDKCSTRWGIRMLPKTYLSNPLGAMTVRVCKSCDWLSNAFCMALIKGSYEDATHIQKSGNVNLRCTFADISREAMFPIHCAVMGGNLALVKWLVEKHDCPLAVRRDAKNGIWLSIQTSASRTLIDLAMTGKPKIDILAYLVQKNLSILDTKDSKLAPKTLQLLLGAGFRFERREGESDSFNIIESSDQISVATIEDACIICCEKSMDCVLSPCGHQVCCSDCGRQMTACPICKKPSSVLKVYRM